MTQQGVQPCVVFRTVYYCNTPPITASSQGSGGEGLCPKDTQHTGFFYLVLPSSRQLSPAVHLSIAPCRNHSRVDLEIPFSTSANCREVTQFSSVPSLLGRAELHGHTSYEAGCLSSCCLHIIYGSIDLSSCCLFISAENMMKCLDQKAGLSYQVKQPFVHSFNISHVPATLSV